MAATNTQQALLKIVPGGMTNSGEDFTILPPFSRRNRRAMGGRYHSSTAKNILVYLADGGFVGIKPPKGLRHTFFSRRSTATNARRASISSCPRFRVISPSTFFDARQKKTPLLFSFAFAAPRRALRSGERARPFTAIHAGQSRHMKPTSARVW